MKHLEIGSEPTLDLYLEHIVEVYREVKRILRPDGLIWVNIGDRFTSGGRKTYDKSESASNMSKGVMRPFDPEGLKPKDLCMLPARVAIALQADGWYLRAQIPWIKRNCMPESAEDRPAVAVEYVFLFSKSPHYFYDPEAVKMPVSTNTHPRTAKASAFPAAAERDEHRRRISPKATTSALGSKQHAQWNAAHSGEVSARNRRNSDWLLESWQGMLTDDDGMPLALIVNPKGETIEHFASYPDKLVEPMIRSSSSDGGCCPKCGANLQRILKKERDTEHQKQCGGDKHGDYFGQATKDYEGAKVQNASDVKRRILAGMTKNTTVCYQPGCDCFLVKRIGDQPKEPFRKKNEKDSAFFKRVRDWNTDMAQWEHELNPMIPVYKSLKVFPCRVLDPFHGTGTTSRVAVNHGRDYTGCEISNDYFKDSDCKDGQTAMHLI